MALLVGVAGFLSTSASQERLPFVPGWEDGWSAHAGAAQCVLKTHIAEYGEVRFVAAPGEAMAFELQARRDLFAGEAISIERVAPGWHPDGSPRKVLGTALHIRGGGAVASSALSERMLWALRSGYLLEVASPAWHADATEVRLVLPPTHLHPALDEFLACAHTDISVAWGDVSRTRVAYEVNDHGLGDAAQERLRAVIRYAQSDPEVTRIFVDGHTDASGSRRHNLTLSKRRAETVARFLDQEVALGDSDAAPTLKIVTRYHGARYPVASNDSAAGKAQNRRTTVRLERANDQRTAAR